MANKTIEQTVQLPASPEAVYNALMDSKQHSEFTRAAANIDNKVDGEFNVWDGYATGKNVELEPGKKIVQIWHASDWPNGVDSRLTIELTPKGEGTELSLHQSGVPAEYVNDVAQGWHDYYWDPLREYLAK